MSTLSRREGVVWCAVFRRLDASAVRAVCSLVDDLTPATLYFVATANLDQVTDAHRPLVDRLAAGKLRSC